jgi:hypothetical protein
MFWYILLVSLQFQNQKYCKGHPESRTVSPLALKECKNCRRLFAKDA